MSRFKRAAERARKAWTALRDNPYVEQIERARRRNEDEPLAIAAAPAPVPDVEAAPVAAATEAELVPRGMRVAGAWAWRIIAVSIVVVGVLYLADMLAAVVIPVLISLLLSAILQPFASLLVRWKFPRSLATFLVLVAGLAAVAGILTGVIQEFVDGVPNLVDSVEKGIGQIQDWAEKGPMHLSDKQINDFFAEVDTQVATWIKENQSNAASTAVDTAGVTFSVAFHTLTGMLLVLFTTFFFMRDGARIWSFLTAALPGETRTTVRDAGHASWRTLVSFVRATILVAFIDAVGIGIGLVLLDIPLAIPLAALVFLTAFVPIIGATVSGAVAVLVALVSHGWVTSLIVLGLVIVVMQLESHVLQPLLLGRAVSVHPLAVILAIGAGVVLAGVIGALIAVPLVAMANTAVKHLARSRRVAPPETDPDPEPEAA
ncbi:AI-2E family transporter [Actinorhabdospora filicis]|uniref:AI-2E family transporter n=1 Tax=Actinorhabdospora filicis TaxID=1785913 RepID=UPI002553B8FC|nr:AI-2E family transporter [Actinorhabdospora filicis]